MCEIGEVLKTENGIEWRIENFSDLSEEDSGYSPDFFFDGLEWFFEIDPFGNEDYNTTDYIDLSLCKASDGLPKNVKFSFALKTVDGEKDVIRHCTEDFHGKKWDEYNCLRFISRTELTRREDELLSSDVLTIICTFETPKSGNIIAEKFVNDFETMLNGDFYDVIIKVKAEEFRLHKCILAARSSYFNSMFKNDMKEKLTGIVTVQDCEPDIFLAFLHFLYSGKLDKLTSDNVCQVYETADKYQEDQLKQECLNLMLNSFSVHTFCNYFELALKHDMKELFQKGVEYFISKAKKICRRVEWQTFVKEYPIQANELFLKTLEKNGK